MNVDTHKLAETLTLYDIDSSGSMCSFIDLKNGWGIKCYDNKEYRDNSHRNQQILSVFDMSPKAGKKFKIVDFNGDTWHCFVTEVAKTIIPYSVDNDLAFDDDDGYISSIGCSYCDFHRKERDEWLNKFEELTGRCYYDDHAGNWGYVYRDGKAKLVVIDFDCCTIEELIPQ